MRQKGDMMVDAKDGWKYPLRFSIGRRGKCPPKAIEQEQRARALLARQFREGLRERRIRNQRLMQWSSNVRDRDGNCCKMCLVVGIAPHLHAHHIHSKAEHPSLMFLLANGITLCDGCHREAHRYRKSDNVGYQKLMALLLRRQ